MFFVTQTIDNIEQHVKECKEMSGRFEELGVNKDGILRKLWGENVGKIKGKVLKRF